MRFGPACFLCFIPVLIALGLSCSPEKSGSGLSPQPPGFFPAGDLEMGGEVVAAPVLVMLPDGSRRLFALSAEGRAACFDPVSAKELWRTETGSGFEAPPAVLGDEDGLMSAVAAASLDGRLFLFDPSTGAVRAEAEGFGSVKGGLAVGTEAGRTVLYTGDYGSTLSKVRADDLRVLGRFSAGNYINGRPCVTSGGLVVFGSCDANLYALSGDSMDVRFTYPAGSYVAAGPVADGGTIFFVTYEGDVSAVTEEGKSVWRYRGANPEPTVATPLLTDTLLVIGTEKGNVTALDRNTGALVWSFSAGSPVGFQPLETPYGIAVCTSGGRLSLLDPRTGTERASYSLGSRPSISGAWDGTYFAIGTETGRILVFTIGGKK